VPKEKKPTLDQVCKILNNDRTRVAWVCRVVDGKIDKMTRILTQYPRDGAGRLTVCVSDWEGGEVRHHIGRASGYGYDKRVAAMSGSYVGGVELGDHCDHKSRPTLRDLCAERGWEVIGDIA
jgi:hypothetical protein